MYYRVFVPAILAAAFCCTYIPQAKANGWDKQTVLTFNQPVEVPGTVLSPGSYTFKLLDSDSDRNIVQIFNQDESHLYTTILAIPDYRLVPKGDTVVTFEERTKGAPQAIQAWFYPGDNYGEEFVYPKVRAMQLASATRQNVPAMPVAQKQTREALKTAPLTAITPERKEVQIAQAIAPKPVQSASAAASPAPSPAPAPAPQELPHTASEVPLIGLVGLTALSFAAVLRLAPVRR